MDTPRKKITEELKGNNNYQEISEVDKDIYDFLDGNLEKKNTDSFSLGFSKNIIREIEVKQRRLFNVKIYSLAVLLGLMGIPLLINLIDSEFILMIFSTFQKYKLTSAFIIVAVTLVQFGGKLLSYRKDIS